MSLFGFGDAYLKTKNAPNANIPQNILVFEGSGLEFASDVSEIEAKSYSKGVLKTKRTAIGEETNTLTLTTQFLDWSHLQFVHDEYASTSNDIRVPVLKTATVPESAPYAIDDPALTSADDVYVYIGERGDWGEAGYIETNTTAATADTVYVDTTNSQLVFNASYAGAPVGYTTPNTYTTVETIGLETEVGRFGALELYFKSFNSQDYPDGLWFHFPTLTRKGKPSINFADSPIQVSLEFGVATPTGRSLPYEIININTAA